jgi:hypothetical protein
MVAPFANAAGAVAQRHADDEKADDVIGRITEEIEGVSLQGCRARRHARPDLNCEHRGVDGKHGP